MIATRISLPVVLAAAFALPGCAGTATKSTGAQPWSDARQLVMVTTADWNATTGTLQRYERSNGRWQAVGDATPITVGRAGSAWGIGLNPVQDNGPQASAPQKREGDGRAPAGVFRIGTAFGYADRAATGWPYQAMTASDWCIDVNDSPLYNRIVDARQVGDAAVAGLSPPVRRRPPPTWGVRYKLGFVIEHNPGNRSGAGSCIFAHLWKGPGETTAGCTAMAEPAMQQLLAWLDPKRKPVFVLLPTTEHERVRKDWDLP